MSVADKVGNFFVSLIPTVTNALAGFVGINIKNFDKLYQHSQEFKTKVDNIVEDYIRKYEDKVAISTPSTSPNIAKFVVSQLQKDKDIVLSLQRQAQNILDKLDREKNDVVVNVGKRDQLADEFYQTRDTFDKTIKNLSNDKVTTAVVKGSQDRFTNAHNYNNWKEKQANAQKKEI